MIQFISATPIDVNYEHKELSYKNCTIIAKNISNLEQGNQEELEDPEPSEEFKAEMQQHFELLKHKVIDLDDREKRQSTGGN